MFYCVFYFFVATFIVFSNLLLLSWRSSFKSISPRDASRVADEGVSEAGVTQGKREKRES